VILEPHKTLNDSQIKVKVKILLLKREKAVGMKTARILDTGKDDSGFGL
jgi:hypothetical protein